MTFLINRTYSFVILWIQKRPSSSSFELFYWMLFQLLFWQNHLVNGSLIIELCQVEIENTSSDVLMLEYQAWFQKYSINLIYGRYTATVTVLSLESLAWYKLHCIKSMKACPRSSHHSAERKFHPGLFLHWCSFSDWSANYGALLFKNRTKIISRQTSVRPVSEYLTPGTKTVIQYDCMPSFANILLASITDIDKNRIVESFGIKKGIKLENNF